MVPPKHPKMIIFSRKTPWLLGKPTIYGNTHMGKVHFFEQNGSLFPKLETGFGLHLTGCHDAGLGQRMSIRAVTAASLLLGRPNRGSTKPNKRKIFGTPVLLSLVIYGFAVNKKKPMEKRPPLHAIKAWTLYHIPQSVTMKHTCSNTSFSCG